MKYLLVFLISLIAACSPATVPATPTAIPTATQRPLLFDMPRFIFQGDNPGVPIVTHDPSPQIMNLYINPGAVLFHEGKFHMFFNSFTAWPGLVKVGYMTSDDGYHWQMAQEEPVLTTDEVPFGNGKADVSSAVVTEDGTWVLYFHTVEDGQIGRATAASPLGPWTVDPEPVLVPGPEDAWDTMGLEWPSVVQDGDELRMYYGVKTTDGHAIGFATSTDGIHWTKYNDPATADAPYVESDPVFTSLDEWEYKKADRPRVVRSPDGWVMIYQAGSSVDQRGLAISEDGITWETYSENPVFSRDVFPIPNARAWDTNLLYHDGAYYYFMEIGTLNGTDLYLAKHEGSLRK